MLRHHLELVQNLFRTFACYIFNYTNMKGKTLSIVGILAAAIGALLIICNTAITKSGVIVTGGILFVGVGLANLIFFGAGKGSAQGTARVLTLIANAAAIILGLCMIVFRDVFSNLIPFIFGLLIAICAIWQFFTLAISVRPVQLPGWLYLFPVAILGGSVYIFFTDNTTSEHIVMLATGIAIALFGISCIIEGSLLGVHNRRRLHPAAPAPADADLDEPISEEEATVEHSSSDSNFE